MHLADRLRVVFGALVLLSLPQVARCDLVRLRNGGEVRGRVEGAQVSSQLPEVTIVTVTGARVTIRRADLEFVTPRSFAHELYESQARTIPDTVDAHWQLAEWCREQRLTRQCAEQLDRVLLLDPGHAAAHHGLGHSLHDGRWMTREELMTSRGYIHHKGRYVTQQELDLIEKTDRQREAERNWYPKIRLWFNWATASDQDRRVQGLRNLQQIDDPDAVPALEANLSEHANRQVRLAFVDILSKLSGSQPMRPLVKRSLEDPDSEVRHLAVAAIPPAQYGYAVELYLAALRHEENAVVCRSAEALGVVGTPAAVAPLIEALVTSHRYRMQVRDPGITVVSGGGTGGMPVESLGNPLLTPEVEAGLRTGQHPYGAIVITPPIMNRTRSVNVKRDHQNREVRSALQKLTGQDFGFDQRLWSLWWTAHQSESGATLPAMGETSVP